jgi:hypothetical protein
MSSRLARNGELANRSYVASYGTNQSSTGDDARLQDDVLVLDEVVERGEIPQTTAAALLEAAVLELIPHDDPVVDPDRAGLDLARDLQRPIDISRPDAGGQAVLAIICKRHRIGFGVEDLHGQAGVAEDAHRSCNRVGRLALFPESIGTELLARGGV